MRLSAADRASLAGRLSLRVDSPTGPALALSELGRVETTPEPQPILHKDLKPVVYVFGDLAGARESPVYALAALNEKIDALRLADGTTVERHAIEPPQTSDRPALKCDGEWQITYEVFRDLGIAFAIVLVLIAILVIGWFQSFTVPLAILLPIPLSLRNAPTKLMKEEGYGAGYEMYPKDGGSLLPEKLRDKKYYNGR